MKFWLLLLTCAITGVCFVFGGWYVVQYGTYPPTLPPGFDLLIGLFWRGQVDGFFRYVFAAAFTLIGLAILGFAIHMLRSSCQNNY